MCGRYYFDNETYRLVEAIVQDNEFDFNQTEKDFFPGENIPVILMKEEKLVLTPLKWGYTMKTNSQRVINARSETVLDKKMFAKDTMEHRCLIPAKGFYEWDAHKRKVAFESQQNHYLLMAGIYREKEKEVTIITTSANAVMQPIHIRMPLMISPDDMQRWLFDNHYLEVFLTSITEDLNIVSGQIQESLFDVNE